MSYFKVKYTKFDFGWQEKVGEGGRLRHGFLGG